VPVRGVIFPDAGPAKWALAGNDSVVVGCAREIERAESFIRNQPGRLQSFGCRECEYAVITLAIRADAGRKEQPAVTAKRKAAGIRYDPRRQDMLAGRVERYGKRP
jgi:hypothetical protein